MKQQGVARSRALIFDWVVATCLVGCAGESTESPSASSASDSTASATDGGEDEGGSTGQEEICVPGAIGCVCLEGACAGNGVCIEDECREAPRPEVDQEDLDVLAGLTVALDGGGEANEFRWEQVEGPAATIEFDWMEQARAYLPGDVEAGTELVFRLTGSRNGAERSADMRVRIIAPQFVDRMADVEGLTLAEPAGFADSDDGLFIASANGTVVRVVDGVVAETFESGSPIADLRWFGESVVVAHPIEQTIDRLDRTNGTFVPLIEGLSGGDPLGEVRRMLPDGDGNLFLATAEGRVLYHDAGQGEGPGVPSTTVFLDGSELPGIASAMALLSGDLFELYGGDEDGSALFVGTTTGQVVRVQLTAVIDDDGVESPAGTVTPFVDAPGGGAISGLAIDATGSLWIGTGTTLHIVQYPVQGDPRVVRSIDGPNGLAGFESLRFSGATLQWTNSAADRLGSLWIGFD